MVEGSIRETDGTDGVAAATNGERLGKVVQRLWGPLWCGLVNVGEFFWAHKLKTGFLLVGYVLLLLEFGDYMEADIPAEVHLTNLAPYSVEVEVLVRKGNGAYDRILEVLDAGEERRFTRQAEYLVPEAFIRIRTLDDDFFEALYVEQDLDERSERFEGPAIGSPVYPEDEVRLRYVPNKYEKAHWLSILGAHLHHIKGNTDVPVYPRAVFKGLIFDPGLRELPSRDFDAVTRANYGSQHFGPVLDPFNWDRESYHLWHIAALEKINTIVEEGHLALRETYDTTDWVEVTLFNAVPYKVDFHVAWWDKDADLHKSRTRTLGPGDTHVYTVRVPEADPRVLVYGEANRRETRQQQIHGDAKLIWGGEELIWDDRRDTYLGYALLEPQPVSRDRMASHYVSFHPHTAHVLSVKGGAQMDIDAFILHARKPVRDLARALQKREFYKYSRYSSGMEPYFLGVRLEDKNNHLGLGVDVAEVLEDTDIFGHALPFHKGDRIIGFEGTPVFCYQDLAIYLRDAAQKTGIERLYEVKFVRGNKVMVARTSYLFNPRYWGYNEMDKIKAGRNGWMTAFTMGLEAEAMGVLKNMGAIGMNVLMRTLEWLLDEPRGKTYELVDLEQYIFEGKQETARLAQFYPDMFNHAKLLGMIGPSMGRTLIQTGYKQLGGRTLGSVTRLVLAEGTETATWMVLDASPHATMETVLEEMMTYVPLSMGVAFGTGLFIKP